MLKWCVSGWNRFQSQHRSMVHQSRPPHFVRGSDPLMQTARGKLQNKRSKLNDQINRQLRLRAGAENLYKATTNKNLRETVATELSYVNSNLQMLKEELADLNSTVHIYQHDHSSFSVPMLPLGLKETKEVDFHIPLTVLISDHYLADPSDYEEALKQLHELRQACRTPVRAEAGVDLLMEYYNQLYYIDKRFFSPNTQSAVYFEWYDSLTGVPAAQRTVGFEKGSVLFNIGALYTQLGARQDRGTSEGVDFSISYFEKASGAFQYLQENFSNAPSMDMQAATLNMLHHLMLAQAQECVFEKVVLRGVSSGLRDQISLAKEASKVCETYDKSIELLLEDKVRDYVPPSWVAMAQVKRNYFSAVAHHITAVAFTESPGCDDSVELQGAFEKLHVQIDDNEDSITRQVPLTQDERVTLAKAHLRQSLLNLEEGLRIHQQSKQLRRIDNFQAILRLAHDRSLEKFSMLEEEDDFSELLSAPDITACTSQEVHAIVPVLDPHTTTDLFHDLGPISVFCAKNTWGRPITVEMTKAEDADFGFSVRGNGPVVVAVVEEGSLSQNGGMKPGDYLVSVGDTDVRWKKQEEVVTLIRACNNAIKLSIVTVTKQVAPKPTSDTPLRALPPKHNNNNIQKSESENKLRSGLSWTLRRRRSSSKDSQRVKHGHAISNAS